MKQIYVESYYRSGYSRFMEHINDILDHPKGKEIETRLKVMEFYDEYGATATKQAFGKSRSTIYLWKQRLRASGGKLSSLAPGDRAPHHKRRRVIDPYIESFVIGYRVSHPGADKTTIAPALRDACEKAGIKSPSESTIGRIIHDLKERGRIPRATRLSINGRTGKLHLREPRHQVKKARRQGFYPKLPGDLVEIDTVDIFVAGLKRYLLTAIDLPTRFAFAYAYKSNFSASAKDFLDKLRSSLPLR